MGTPKPGEDFRMVMGRFATGVTVVTSRAGEEIHGMTVNAFLSVSLAPPTVLVSLSKGARTERLVREGRVFAVNILGADQSPLSDRFAGRHKDKEGNRFDGFEWSPEATGAPIFKGVLAWLDCKLVTAFDGGDHTLFLGEAVAARSDDQASPLLFFQSRYRSLQKQP
jgi:flavin reductase (DIM6/NTAB) family NADH-FMN oxidoreductase RutF